MLTDLKIENVAVIEKANIFFEDGLNVLSGETGAGKSIIIDSINAVLGERTSKDVVRSGAASAKVTAYFEDISQNACDILDELEVDRESDNSLLITRSITSDGRTSCKINGQQVTASMLKKIGRELITICGQHDSQHLLQKESHLGYIDMLANCGDLLESYRESYHKMLAVRKELTKLNDSESDKQQRLDFLSFQINELENANITTGERERLLSEKKRIQNREKIISALQNAYGAINGDEGGILNGLYSLSNALETLTSFDSNFGDYLEKAENFRYEIEECLSEVSSGLSDFEEGETDIDSIEERLDILYRLSKKYGQTEEEMLSFLEKAKNEYDSIAFSSERKAKLEEELSSLEAEVFTKGCHISDCRKKAALNFEQQVSNELMFLDMPNASFAVRFSDEEPGENGIDDVEFLISVNRGQEEKPLVKIASGGELSRIMLAIRCVLSRTGQNETMIFDEIDAGVSGRAANRIASKLQQVSKGRQVICVTHLAQIAASADCHFLIEKSSDISNTYTKVSRLDGVEREREIARIIGGDVITEATLSSARELIEFGAGS